MPNYTPFLPLLAVLAAAPLVACSSADPSGTGGSEGTSTSTSTATGSGGAAPAARVIVRDHAGRPAVGVDVLVHDATGKTTQQLKTDATGAATIELVEGGGVTALYTTVLGSSSPRASAVSVVGLAAGAEVRLVADPYDGNDAPSPMTLAFNGLPPLLPADWDIVASCNEDTTASEKSLVYSGCSNSSTYDLVAFLSGGDKRVVFPAQPFQPGKSVPFSIDPANVEVATRIEVDVEGAPAGTTTLQARLSANRPEGGRTQLSTSQSPIQQGSLIKIPRLPVSAGGTFDLDVVAATAEGALIATFPFTADKLPTSALAWSPLAVPYASTTGTITGTAQRPEVPWTITPGAMPADSVRIVLDYVVAQRPADWTLYMASSVGATAKFPEIPASFVARTPKSGSTVLMAVQHVDVAGTASLLAAVNAEFDRTGAAWSSTSLTATAP